MLGGAILTGVIGGAVFAAIGLVAMLPFLLHLRRRLGTWIAPVGATALFGVVFLASSLFVGPLVRSVGTAPVRGPDTPDAPHAPDATPHDH